MGRGKCKGRSSFGFGCSVSTFGLSFSHFRLVEDRACEGFWCCLMSSLN
jgi:hypothetical protein